MSATVIEYERGDRYVEHTYKAEVESLVNGVKTKIKKDATARGLVGTLWVGAYAFDTLERMEGFVHLKPGDYAMSSMYDEAFTGGTHGLVVNPWLGKAAENNKQLRNILIHSGERANNFEGCIGPGFLTDDGALLKNSKESMELIWEQCGGPKNRKDKNVVVTLRVLGEMPGHSKLKKISQ